MKNNYSKKYPLKDCQIQAASLSSIKSLWQDVLANDFMIAHYCRIKSPPQQSWKGIHPFRYLLFQYNQFKNCCVQDVSQDHGQQSVNGQQKTYNTMEKKMNFLCTVVRSHLITCEHNIRYQAQPKWN